MINYIEYKTGLDKLFYYGDANKLPFDVLFILKESCKDWEKGITLKQAIKDAMRTMDNVLGLSYPVSYNLYKTGELEFPMDFGKNLSSLYDEVRVAVTNTLFSDVIGGWTSDMNGVGNTIKKNEKWSSVTFNQKELSNELEYIFNRDIEGIKGIDFLYKKVLKAKIAGYQGKKTNEIGIEEFSALWDDFLVQIEDSSFLNPIYKGYTKNYYAEDVKHLIDSMDLILPQIDDLTAVLKSVKNSKSGKKIKKLNPATNVLVANYVMNWANRETLVEITSKEIKDEIPAVNKILDKATEWGAKILSTINDRLPEGVQSKIELMKESAENALIFMLRTEVESDNINVEIPIVVNKTYKDGKRIMYGDIDELNDGKIGFIKKSPYTLERVYLGKQGKPIFSGNQVTQNIEMVIDFSDMALGKAISGGGSLGLEVGYDTSISFTPKQYTLRFSIRIVSVFENDQLTVRIIPADSVDPTSEACPEIVSCIGPEGGVEEVIINPYVE